MIAIAFVVFILVFWRKRQMCPEMTDVIQKELWSSYNGKVRNTNSALVRAECVQDTYWNVLLLFPTIQYFLMVPPSRT